MHIREEMLIHTHTQTVWSVNMFQELYPRQTFRIYLYSHRSVDMCVMSLFPWQPHFDIHHNMQLTSIHTMQQYISAKEAKQQQNTRLGPFKCFYIL